MNNPQTVLLIDNYDSFTYNLYQCIESLGYKCKVARNDEMSIEQIRALNPSHIVISPGPGNPSEAGISLSVIEKLGHDFPILGVCLGHQSIGQAFGADVVRAKRTKHGKLSLVNHDGLGLFQGLENPLTAARYHSLVIDPETLPECLVVTSNTEDGVIMGVRHKKFRIEGVQFHPESIATKNGTRLIENFLRAR